MPLALYREWMRRLQDFLASRPAPQTQTPRPRPS
jgi:hypothetical protein